MGKRTAQKDTIIDTTTDSQVNCNFPYRYASEVWDGCNQIDSNRLEQVQLNAARIVTGLPIFASLNSLYFETGWETLSERRKNKKLSLMYKIVNNDAPPYLQELLPNTVNESTNYNLRNSQNFDVPFFTFVLI